MRVQAPRLNDRVTVAAPSEATIPPAENVAASSEATEPEQLASDIEEDGLSIQIQASDL